MTELTNEQRNSIIYALYLFEHEQARDLRVAIRENYTERDKEIFVKTLQGAHKALEAMGLLNQYDEKGEFILEKKND